MHLAVGEASLYLNLGMERVCGLGLGEPDNVLCLYRAPKGLFVLEALAAGVPVVLPAHGAFPELIEATGGGRLVTPNDPIALADELEKTLLDRATRYRLGRAGASTVHERFNADVMARLTLEVMSEFFPAADG